MSDFDPYTYVSSDEQANIALKALKHRLYEHESLLHQIQLYAEVAMNREKISQLIGLICSWSYAHRVGNGENTEEEQDAIVERAWQKIVDFK